MHGHGMRFKKFYSLNQRVGAWFAHLHQVCFQPFLTNLGKCLWWYWFEWKAICPSTTWEGAQTPHICIPWKCDAVWKVLKPQPKHSGIVSPLASGRISANFPKFREASPLLTVLVWSHMPIHNLRRHSNTSYMYKMDMRCSLKGSTASIKV